MVTTSPLIALKRRNKVGKEDRKAVAYLRTSSAANVGEDKDSGKRQRTAIQAFAKTAGYRVRGQVCRLDAGVVRASS